jgi:hypothetical protein
MKDAGRVPGVQREIAGVEEGCRWVSWCQLVHSLAGR